MNLMEFLKKFVPIFFIFHHIYSKIQTKWIVKISVNLVHCKMVDFICKGELTFANCG